MINTLSKINLSKIGYEGGRSTSIWIMSTNILGFFWTLPLSFSFVFVANLWYFYPSTVSIADRVKCF